MTIGKQSMESEKQQAALRESDSPRNRHVNSDLFCDWQAGRMRRHEEEQFFVHIGSCTFCAQQVW